MNKDIDLTKQLYNIGDKVYLSDIIKTKEREKWQEWVRMNTI